MMASQCAAENVDHAKYLLRLAELELIDRHQRMVERRIRSARFPAVKSLDTFDFLVIPSVNKVLVAQLARCEYIQRRENVIAVGNKRNRQDSRRPRSGTGRLPAGYVRGLHYGRSPGPRNDGGQGREASAEFTETAVPAQPADHRRTGLRAIVPHRCGTALRGVQPALRARLHHGNHQPALRRVDGGVRVRKRLTGALLDRLTHHVHILEMNGESYRLKRSRENAVPQAPDDPTDA